MNYLDRKVNRRDLRDHGEVNFMFKQSLAHNGLSFSELQCNIKTCKSKLTFNHAIALNRLSINS